MYNMYASGGRGLRVQTLRAVRVPCPSLRFILEVERFETLGKFGHTR